MAVEIRALRDAQELDHYQKNVNYVFASAPSPDDDLTRPAADWTTCALVDGRLATTLATLPFTVRLNGNPVKMGGVTAVGTLPAYRRQGLLRQVMTSALSTMRDRDQSLAILWASMGAIYQRFGYGLSTGQTRYSFDPRVAQFNGPGTPDGTVEMYEKEEGFPFVKQNYIQWVQDKNLGIHRSTILWQASTLRANVKEHPVYCAVYRNTDGEVTGHAIYQTKEGNFADPGPGQVMDVSDFIARDMDAYRALWDYLRAHDLVRRIDMRGVAEDDPAPELLLEPRVLQRKTSDGIWMRVVDVEKALPQRPYGARGELTIGVPEDTDCPWNVGTYLLETDGQTTSVRRTDLSPDITVTPNVLASLISGYRPASHFARAGRLVAKDTAALRTADTLFRTEYAPYCPNGF
ncbi:MAG: GNAT family N-acetyltransferase [Dehalococcoidia bacterium]|nr:GNAT family N-acetyltransferase [Dehalococcoidia bacterium]